MSGEYEEEYWKDRNSLEEKHYWQVARWLYYFEVEKGIPIENCLDYGCGRGEYVHALRSFSVAAVGFDVSKHAIGNAFGLADGNCYNVLPNERFDFVLCYDVLEHLSLEEIPATIDSLVEKCRRFLLLSICMANETGVDSNYYKDKTHKTLRTKTWWKYQFEKKGLKKLEIPSYFLFRNQLLLFEK